MRAQAWARVNMHHGHTRRLIPTCTSRGLPWVYFFKNRFIFSLKDIIFHFNTSQVNLTFDWALNQPWVLEFQNHWGMGAQVVRGTKYGVYMHT